MILSPTRFFRPAGTGTLLALISFALVGTGCQAPSVDDPAAQGAGATDSGPYVMAGSPVEAGRYLVIVAGCNDCHTDGYLQQNGQIPEENWLAGSAMGWRGPWGTTYASNLRLSVQDMDEDDWVLTMHERDVLPPMPWMNVNQMSDEDARAIYRYVVSLGPTGEATPGALPPGVEPETPFISLEPQNLGPPPSGE